MNMRSSDARTVLDLAIMTNQEALRLIKSTDYCYVVWSIATNAIIAVHPVPRDPSPGDLLAAISKMESAHAGAKGRFLDPGTTTLATLEEEQRDEERISSRQSIFESWLPCSTEELIRKLEAEDFQPPMDLFHGPRHIIEELYYAPDRVVSKEQLERLDAVCGPASQAAS
jgi:hypothetical protein